MEEREGDLDRLKGKSKVLKKKTNVHSLITFELFFVLPWKFETNQKAIYNHIK